MTEVKAEYKTEAWEHNWGGRYPSLLCGEWHEQAYAGVRLLEVDANGEGTHCGDVCPNRITAGPARR